MNNQILKLHDGSFEIGKWIQDAQGEVAFFECDTASSFKEAVEKAVYYDDEDFKFAKYEIELIGGVESARKILEQMDSLSAIAITYQKDQFDLSQVNYLDAYAHAKFLEEKFEDNKHPDVATTWKSEIEANLHTIRFLEL